MVAQQPTNVWQTPLIPIIVLVVLYVCIQIKPLSRIPSSSFVFVDTVSPSNWTSVESSHVSLFRVHQSSLLHKKVWIVPFDEMWNIALSVLPPTASCINGLGAIESHVSSGASIASAASEVATGIKAKLRINVDPLLPLGRPFLYEHNGEKEIVHMFGMPMRGSFPRNRLFRKVVKPVRFVNGISKGKGAKLEKYFCGQERADWLKRATSYAMRRMHLKGHVPQANPMDDAVIDEEICCEKSIDDTEDLRSCGLRCDREGVFNILTVFPQT